MSKKRLKSKKKKDKEMPLFLCLILFSIGAICLSIGFSGIFYTDDESNWQNTEGRILSYRIVDESTSSKQGRSETKAVSR